MVFHYENVNPEGDSSQVHLIQQVDVVRSDDLGFLPYQGHAVVNLALKVRECTVSADK